MVKIVAGIDISKASLDICAAGQTRRFANDATSWRALGTWLRGLEVSRGGHGPLSPQGSPVSS